MGNKPKNCIFFRDGNENQTGSCHTICFLSASRAEVNQTHLCTCTPCVCGHVSLSLSDTDRILSVHRPRLRDIRPNTRWSRTRWRDHSQTWRNSEGKVKERTLQSMRVKRTRYVCFYSTYMQYLYTHTLVFIFQIHRQALLTNISYMISNKPWEAFRFRDVYIFYFTNGVKQNMNTKQNHWSINKCIKLYYMIE